MASAKLKKFNTMGKIDRRLLKDIINRIDMGSFDLMNNPIFQRGQDFLRQMQDPQSQMYQNFEAPYRRQYQEETVPRIAEQFAAYDAMDSGAFKQALSRSAVDLESNIANMRQGMMEGVTQNALSYAQAPGNAYQNLVNQALGTPSFAYQAIPGSEGWGQSVFGGFARGASAVGTMWGMNKLGSGSPQESRQVTSWNQFNGQPIPSQAEMAGW